MVRHHFVNVAGIGQRERSLFRVAAVGNAENLALSGVGFQIPRVSHDLAFAVLLFQLDVTEINVAPVLRDALGKANGRAADFGTAAGVRVDRALGKTAAGASVQDAVARCAFVAGEMLGHDHGGLHFLCLSGGGHGGGYAGRADGFGLVAVYVGDFITHSRFPPF